MVPKNLFRERANSPSGAPYTDAKCASASGPGTTVQGKRLSPIEWEAQ